MRATSRRLARRLPRATASPPELTAWRQRARHRSMHPTNEGKVESCSSLRTHRPSAASSLMVARRQRCIRRWGSTLTVQRGSPSCRRSGTSSLAPSCGGTSAICHHTACKVHLLQSDRIAQGCQWSENWTHLTSTTQMSKRTQKTRSSSASEDDLRAAKVQALNRRAYKHLQQSGRENEHRW